MKITIEELASGEQEQVIIRCHHVTGEILRAIEILKQTDAILAFQNDHIFRLSPADVYYFESVDNNVFVYDRSRVFESKNRLYELEEQLESSGFIRVSKSVVLNLAKVESISPALNGRFEALLDNSERVIISRQYVPLLKRRFGL